VTRKWTVPLRSYGFYSVPDFEAATVEVIRNTPMTSTEDPQKRWTHPDDCRGSDPFLTNPASESNFKRWVRQYHELYSDKRAIWLALINLRSAIERTISQLRSFEEGVRKFPINK